MSDLNTLNGIIERAYEVMGKKLTTKQRKKMKKSTFCGPGRSFPVNDCEHVRVAKAYLGRSNFSVSTKKKIAACINRKAKQLGCTVTKKAKAYTEYNYDRLSDEAKSLYDSEVFVTTRDLVEDSIENPDMDLDFNAQPDECDPCEVK